MTIAKPLQVVASPPQIISIFRPRLAYSQWRFVPMWPSSVFFFLLHPTPCCPEKRANKIFQKFFPVSMEAHNNCQTTTSGVLSYRNHKPLQTTGGLFWKTFRAIVPFVSFFLIHPTPCCPEIWAVKIFEKFYPDSLEAHENCHATTSDALSSPNHKQFQTTGGLFSKTFRANVPFVSLFFTSHHTMLSRNLSSKNIPKV